MKRFLSRAFWLLVASLFLAEAWLWHKLGGLIAALADRLPLTRAKHWLDVTLNRLPAYGVLAIFLVPVLLLEPLKFVALALIAGGHIVYAVILFVVAKIVGFGVISFLFGLCREKLLQIDWFKRLYDFMLRALVWAHARVDPYRIKLKAEIAKLRGYLQARANGHDLWRRFRLLRQNCRRETLAP